MRLLASTTYDAIDKATRFVSEIHPHLKLETIAISPSYTLEGIFRAFEAGLGKVQSSPEYMALTELGRRPKIVVIVDALSSAPGLLMPWERVVELCKHHENVWSLVDAAQAIGQIVGINLNKIQPDFFISVGAIFVGQLSKFTFPRRTATNGCTRSVEARFSMYRKGRSTISVKTGRN